MNVYWEMAQAEIRELRSALAETGAGFIAATRERDEALATIERVKAAVDALLKLQYAAFDDAEAGHRGSRHYADAYEHAGLLITEALEAQP